jgi:hypothetical protein
MGAQKARIGRPSLLTDATEARVVAALAAGGSVRDAAAAAGVSARTVWSWMQRARSRDPADARHVAFERRVTRALLARTGGPTAMMVSTPIVSMPEGEEPAIESWEMIAARLEAIAPERWALDWPEDPDQFA